MTDLKKILDREYRVVPTGRKVKPDARYQPREDLLAFGKFLHLISLKTGLTFNAISKISGIPQAKISQMANCKHEPNRQTAKSLCNLFYLVTGITITRDDLYQLIDEWEQDNPCLWESDTLINEEGQEISLLGLMRVKLLIGSKILDKYLTYERFIEREKLQTLFTPERLEELLSLNNKFILTEKEIHRICNLHFLRNENGNYLLPADIEAMMAPENQNSAPELTKAELSNFSVFS